MHTKNIHTAGKPVKEAKKALIMLHGRGADAQNILGLAAHLKVDDFALLAPQATHNTWYPYSFLTQPSQNQPWLSSALDLLKELVKGVMAHGIPKEYIYFLGFSQGACLTLEFVTENAKKYGGVVAFTGGLIGDKIYRENYSGDFEGTPVFLSTGNPDPHVPMVRVRESVRILEGMNAKVNLQVYEGRSHSISPEEIKIANDLIFKKK